MIDFSSLLIGDKLGCKYTFTTGVAGEFSGLKSVPNENRKVKDPLLVDGSYFEGLGMEVRDPVVMPITSKIKMLTSRTFKTTNTVLTDGTLAETDEYVDLSLYKTIISLTTDPSVVLTEIPKDTIIQTKNLININDYASAINSITINATNLFCKVAITLDGTTYYTYDSTNSIWVVVDMTQSLDVLKTVLADYTTINSLATVSYSGLSLNGEIGFKILIGIDGTDTALNYSFDGITIDYVGTRDDTPSIQYFNFVFAGYTKDGNPKFIADMPVQTEISYSTLYNANFVLGKEKINIVNSEIARPCYIGLLSSGVSSNYSTSSEYDVYIANNTIIPTSSKTNTNFWDTSIATITKTIACNVDTNGIAAGTTNIVVRGGESIDKYTNFGYSTNNTDVGFRPVLIIDLNSPLETRPDTVLPIVTSISDLAIGKAISCEYKATEGSFGKFVNLGKAAKGFLKTFDNSVPDGTFFFNCVGYTKEGKLKLVADRVIQTNISLSSYYTDDIPSVISGRSVKIDRQTHTMRLLNALSEKEPTVAGGEYDKLITNALDTSKTIEQLWHTTDCLSLTNTISNENATAIISKGFGEEGNTRTTQRHFLYTDTNKQLGIRPVLIIEPSTKIEILSVIPYVGYEIQTGANTLEVDIVITKNDGTNESYALIKKDDSVILSDYSTDQHRSIDITKLTSASSTTISIVENTNRTIVDEFTVYRDELYRSSTTRSFGDIYGGYTTDNVEVIDGVAKPKSNTIVDPILSGSASYINITTNTKKVMLN